MVRANLADDASDFVNILASCQQNPAGKSLEMITSRVELNRLPTSPPPPRVVRVDVSTPHGEVLTGELRFVAATPAVVDVEMAAVQPTTAASRRSRTQRVNMLDLSTGRCNRQTSIMIYFEQCNDGWRGDDGEMSGWKSCDEVEID